MYMSVGERPVSQDADDIHKIWRMYVRAHTRVSYANRQQVATAPACFVLLRSVWANSPILSLVAAARIEATIYFSY